ncbi:hypothetical protein Bca101_093008 [Brassica carinata]
MKRFGPECGSAANADALQICTGGARLFMQFQKVGSSPANVHIFLQSSLVLQKVRHLQYDGSSPGKVHNFLQSSSILQGPLYTHLFAGKLIENNDMANKIDDIAYN